MKQILVIGTSGTGKSTLAQRLSTVLHLPFFASDPFYWDAHWKPASDAKVLQQVKDVIRREAWILDGNFDNERELVWRQADCIIWLDYSLATICKRVIFRNLFWVLTQQPIWSGNRMTLHRALSGLRHAIRSYSLKRQNYPHWLAELPDITVHRFHTPHETETWLQNLKQA